MNINLNVWSVLLLMCLVLSFSIVYAESTATEGVNATLSNNTTNESVSVHENTTNVTLSENATNPFAKTKGWKDSSTPSGGGIKN
ncbi:MAG: hypothetical protein WAW52_03085 [Methanothrix sp.]